MKNLDEELAIPITSIEKSRSIVNEIINYGVNDQEKVKIISLLALELENINLTQKINEIIKKEFYNKEVLESVDNEKSKKILI